MTSRNSPTARGRTHTSSRDRRAAGTARASGTWEVLLSLPLMSIGRAGPLEARSAVLGGFAVQSFAPRRAARGTGEWSAHRRRATARSSDGAAASSVVGIASLPLASLQAVTLSLPYVEATASRTLAVIVAPPAGCSEAVCWMKQ